ncbi:MULTISPECIES: 3-hydroxyacyl-ACP dehydratase FabZ family protein [Gimesia]|mgnify:FL=1|jgi:3-hydroxyacyl-[acyl-carrier-protein] dehydratase|uniref:Beta-hydroxyacyl-ACP dehydratase n=2 Tax=Gimesia TaxID=1649453 RepID=A0A6I6AI01_9PLAN|nr:MULTISPECIES: 3-hydroxyacyl-ACP dehydratase FabZ family protein [Gimesia]MBN70137.1 beta-hydroxyacyl-ACP dehydratase [Gimesia sp.]MCR9229780.1 beta-hydroxyacyl-ACP dehydratase [bacterium]QDT23995.1 3-hydroxyacyl-[acyl-carrier-protein] dehydratase FabZ [Gimesia chilikensis]QDT87791.1 3-hydroxyacyl-[acyl-carrier-protein] dehydratase FabZ [Gimesia chilikensis]QGQ24289.1 beta-hydroxyacyl-ACP dehydratase [Gimesia benthica]
MRWFWIDRFIEFESGSYAKSVKNVTLAEEHLHDHFPGFPVMPGSLMIEGMAQTGGILLGEINDFEHIVILAKVPQMTFHSWACPGDQLIYTAKITNAGEEGGAVDVTAMVGDRLVAEGSIIFVHLDQSDSEFGKIDQKNFVFSMNLLGILDVGQAGTGEEQA